ncbi:hypothetical protein MMC25_002531 [Agyrium rufum]|nr:hypothetical protein [Agyrium rufum]
MNSQQTYTSRVMGPSPFFYYNPEINEQRQNAHFTPDPATVTLSNSQFYQPYPHGMVQQSHFVPTQARPSTSQNAGSSTYVYTPTLLSTPMASPRPMYQKPMFLMHGESHQLTVDIEHANSDMSMYPATPPLSVSGSSLCSPPLSSGILATPMDSSFYGAEKFKGVKEGCEGDVQTEILATGDWTRCGSPAMTPIYVHPRPSSTNTDLLSVNSCPSLSPSPSPVPRTTSAEVSFCDPRNLFVSSPTISSRSSPVEVQQYMHIYNEDNHSHAIYQSEHSELCKPQFDSAFDNLNGPLLHHIPSFDNFSEELASEDNEFVTDLTQFVSGQPLLVGLKREKLELLSFSEEEPLSEESFEEFEYDDRFAAPALEDPLQSDLCSHSSPEMTSPKPKSKKRALSRKSPKKSSPESETEFESHANEQSNAESTKSPQASEPQQDASSTTSHANSSDGNAVASNSSDATIPISHPTTRRGRKQSLTEDPSKAFVCNICSRRFRRQEHLKRHTRSLHTQEKPFECTDCGKTFSRSDNLAQHARTHGTGAVLMGVYEDGQYTTAMVSNDVHAYGDPNILGNVLFEAVQAVAGDDSSSSLSDTTLSIKHSASPPPSEDGKPARKRKRDE